MSSNLNYAFDVETGEIRTFEKGSSFNNLDIINSKERRRRRRQNNKNNKNNKK